MNALAGNIPARHALRSARVATRPGLTRWHCDHGPSIGAVTAVFTLVESIRCVPSLSQPARLVTVSTFMRTYAEITASPDYSAWRDSSRALAGVAGYSVDDFNFSGAGDPDRLQGVFTTANFFSVLGVRPYLGRTYTAEDWTSRRHVLRHRRTLQTRFSHPGANARRHRGQPALVIGDLSGILIFSAPSQSKLPGLIQRRIQGRCKPMRILQVLARLMQPEICSGRRSRRCSNGV